MSPIPLKWPCAERHRGSKSHDVWTGELIDSGLFAFSCRRCERKQREIPGIEPRAMEGWERMGGMQCNFSSLSQR